MARVGDRRGCLNFRTGCVEACVIWGADRVVGCAEFSNGSVGDCAEFRTKFGGVERSVS